MLKAIGESTTRITAIDPINVFCKANVSLSSSKMDCDFFLQEKLVASMSREELDPASSAEDAVSDIKLTTQ